MPGADAGGRGGEPRCPSCGALVGPGAEWCGQCFARLEPARALGGFSGELYGYDVRIDYVQHNLSALLCAADALAAP